jgi:hypothetical protein
MLCQTFQNSGVVREAERGWREMSEESRIWVVGRRVLCIAKWWGVVGERMRDAWISIVLLLRISGAMERKFLVRCLSWSKEDRSLM